MARREFQNPSVLVRETPRGDEWYIRYRVRAVEADAEGRPQTVRKERWHPLGLVSEMTKRKAERKRDEIMREINGQVYAIQAHIPWSDFCDLFETNFVPTLAVPSQITYKQWMRLHVRPAFAGKRLCDIKPMDCQMFLMKLELAYTTRRAIQGLLSSVFKRAREWGYWQAASPVIAPSGKKTQKRVRQKRIPTPEQVRQIIAAVDADRGLIIETLVYTGMRISECLGLRPRAFDLERKVVAVTERQCRGDVDDPKSGTTRVLPLGRLADRYADKLKGLAPDAFVFTDKKGRPYKDCELLANYLTPRLTALGLKWPGFGWHTFRRLLATWMHESGASVFEIMEQLGHSKPDTTRLYVVGDVERRARVVRKIQRKFGKVG